MALGVPSEAYSTTCLLSYDPVLDLLGGMKGVLL